MTYPEILLALPITPPLHGVNPRSIKGDTWWRKTRAAACESTEDHCIACGVHKSEAKYRKWMEAHEDYEIDIPNFEYRLKRIVPLCHACHNYIHIARLNMLLRKGEITVKKFQDIVRHGNDLVRPIERNGAKSFDTLTDAEKTILYRPELTGSWSKWHLKFEGTDYFSPNKTYEDWQKTYQSKGS